LPRFYVPGGGKKEKGGFSITAGKNVAARMTGGEGALHRGGGGKKIQCFNARGMGERKGPLAVKEEFFVSGKKKVGNLKREGEEGIMSSDCRQSFLHHRKKSS